MGHHGIWYMLRAHHSSPVGEGRPLELVPAACPVHESLSCESDRGDWQRVWSSCCLVYRCVALCYCSACMGACKAHSGAAVSLVWSFHCATAAPECALHAPIQALQ